MNDQKPKPNPRRSFSSLIHYSDPDNRVTDFFPQLVLIIGSVSILVLCQILRKNVPTESRFFLNVLIPICLVLFFLGIWSVERSHLPIWVEKLNHSITMWMKISVWQMLLLIFSILFSMLTCVAAGFSANMLLPRLAVICWGVGILLALIGGMRSIVLHQKVSLPVLLTGLAFFVGAFAIRAFSTRTIPIVLSGDEASSGLFSLNFLNGFMDNIFITGWFSFPSFHNYLQSLSIVLFGQTTQALRLLSAFSGALTVALVFFVGRSMFGNLGGVLSALFLTGLHLHLHFSRIGLNNIWDGFFITMVVGCLWIGWQHDKRSAYLVAGFGLGLSQYFYTSSRVLVLIIPLWLLTAGLSDHKRFRKAIPNLLLMFWTTLIVFLPLGWYFLKNPNELLAPMNRVTIMGEWMTQTMQQTGQTQTTIILKQIWQGIRGYVDLPLRMWYEPGVPALRGFPSILFLLGIMFMLLHPKDSRNQIIVFWLCGITLAVGMSESTPAAQRFVAATPAIALLVGFGLKRIGDIALRFLPKAGLVVNISLVVIMAALSIDDARFYYLDYTPNSNFSGINGRVAQHLANRLKDEPAGLEVVFCGYPVMGYNSINSLPYLANQITYFNMDATWQAAETVKPSGDRILFVFLPNHESDIQLITNEYVGGTWSQEFSSKNEILYSLYEYNTPD
jgi:hypothetical protein